MRSSEASYFRCRRHQKGGVGIVLLVLSMIAVGGLLLLFYLFGETVNPGAFGVRQIYLGVGKGYGARGLKPGVHWAIPYYSTVHLIPSTVQIYEYSRNSPHPALDIKTADGAIIDVDVSLMVRFYSEATNDHGGPRDLIGRLGLNPANWEDQVRKTTEAALRQTLSQLSTSQFYVPEERFMRTQRAYESVKKILAPMGISLEEILIRRYTYRNPQIDEAIFRKNLQDQEEKLNEASSKLSEVKAKLEQVSAEWDAKIQTLRVKGENEAQVLRSEASLYEDQTRAEGDLAVSLAQAEVDKKRAQALASTEGAQVYVARELTPYLTSLQGGVVSQLDPYDLQAWSEKLLGNGTSKSGGEAR